MLDVVPLIQNELARLAPYDTDLPDDWTALLARAGINPAVSPRRQRIRMLGVALAVLVVGVVFVAPALGLHPPFVDFFSAKHAPKPVVRQFAQLNLGGPRGMNPQAIPGQTRLITTYHLRNGKALPLWVTPSRKGGFCYILGGGGCLAPGSHSHGEPGDLNPGVLDVARFSAWHARVIEGSVANHKTAKLELRFANGQTTLLPLLWVSKPIDRGFYLYQLTGSEKQPSGRPIALVALDQNGQLLARVTSAFRLPSPWSNPNHVSNKADRRVILRSGPLSIAIAPSRTGGNCSWVRYRTATISSGCAPPRFQTTAMAGGLSHGTGFTSFDAQLKPDVTRVALRFQDGATVTLTPVDGFVLYNIPKTHWPRGHRLIEAAAYNRGGAKLATEKFDPLQTGLYDCTKTIPLGAGLKACP
jgi:hypothetical protein